MLCADRRADSHRLIPNTKAPSEAVAYELRSVSEVRISLTFYVFIKIFMKI